MIEYLLVARISIDASKNFIRGGGTREKEGTNAGWKLIFNLLLK